MSELKLIKVIEEDISAIKVPAEALTTLKKVIETNKVHRLDTAVRYIEQDIEIGALMDLYSSLMLKDVLSLLSAVETIVAMDETLASRK